MSSRVRLVALALVVAAAAPARAQTAIDGTLRNGTTGATGKADVVNLIRLAGGMSQLAQLEHVEGKFHFDLREPGPYMVQVQYHGVTYMNPIPPLERGIATPEVTVFDTTTDASLLRVSLPHLIVIVDGPKVHVSRVFDIENASTPPRAVTGEPGAFRFDLPDAASGVSAQVTSSKMPLRQEPLETKDGKGKTIQYALKPGTTRFEIEHDLPYKGEIEIRETLWHGARSLNAIVVPGDVTVEAPGLESSGKQERQGVSFLTFTGRDLPAGQVVTLHIRGEARAPRPPGTEGSEAEDGAEGAPGGAPAMGGVPGATPRAVPNRVFRGASPYLIAGTALALLLAALTIALRQPASAGPAREPARRRVTPKAEALLDEIALLDDRLARGESAEREHGEARSSLKRALLEELQAARRSKKTA